MSEAALDLERQKEAKTYARIHQRLMIVDIAIGGLYCLAWLVFGWSLELKSWLLTFTTNEWLLVAGFGIIFGGIFILINLPLSHYEGFLLPHRFNMSNQTIKGWITDQLKGLLIGLLLGGLMI